MALAVRLANSQMSPTQVELVKLQLHGLTAAYEYAGGWNWSFAEKGEVCRELPRDQARYGRIWSFAVRIISAPRTPMKSEPCVPELVFREVPGKLVQGSGQSQRFRIFPLRRALVNTPRDGITGVAIAPVCLGLLPSRRLTVGISTGPLPGSHARVRPEPPATDRARSLPGLGHRDDPSSSSRLLALGISGQFRMPGSFLESRGG